MTRTFRITDLIGTLETVDKATLETVDKATLVGVVAALCGESEDVFDSLLKANKNVIAIIAQTIMTDENIAQVSCEDYLPCEDYIPYDET
jgi:hypothetical protein